MNYTIRPGNIAAVCHVNDETFIYLAPGKLPVTAPRDSTAEFLALPLAVRAAVNKHFFAVFSLAAERRGEYLRHCVEQTIEAAP